MDLRIEMRLSKDPHAVPQTVLKDCVGMWIKERTLASDICDALQYGPAGFTYVEIGWKLRGRLELVVFDMFDLIRKNKLDLIA